MAVGGLLLFVVAALVLGVVGVGVGLAIAASRRGGAPALPGPRLGGELLAGRLQDVRKGGLIQVGGMGDDFEDLDLEVERADKYSLGREAWHVLETTYRGRPVGVEWSEDRGALAVYAHKRLRRPLSELGLDPATLGQAREVTVDGHTLALAHEGKAFRHDNVTGFGKEHQAWAYFSADRKHVLRVERWGDQTTASLGERIEPSTIRVFRSRA